MIETDLNNYLSKLDAYVKQSIELVETASELYGKLIDKSITKSEFADSIKNLSDDLNTIYVEIGDFSIDDLAPDPFQDLHSAFHCFISMCGNYMIFLSRLGENGNGNHWIINKTIEDIQTFYASSIPYLYGIPMPDEQFKELGHLTFRIISDLERVIKNKK